MSIFDVSANPAWLNGLLFLAAAAAVWIAGTRLSAYADEIADRTGLGEAFAGLVLLATVTSLPEIATTATAAVIGNAALVTSNLFGGIAMQTAILSIVDWRGVKGALTSRGAKPVLLVQGVILVLMLAAAVLVAFLREPISVAGVGAGSVFLFGLYLMFLLASRNYQHSPRWSPIEDEDGRSGDRGIERGALDEHSNKRLYGVFGGLAAAVAVAGWIVARTGDALAAQTGIDSSLVGAILVAISTSLPEVSTTLSAARLGAYGMAVSNIFGSNALMLALTLPGDMLYDGILLRVVEPSTTYLLPLGIFVTCVYLWGLLERRDRTLLGMGLDSIIVLAVYFAGMAGMYYMLQSAGSDGMTWTRRSP